MVRRLSLSPVECTDSSVCVELAPEFKYPSQLIEVLASYHHLVNDLGISADKIVLSGDSGTRILYESSRRHLLT